MATARKTRAKQQIQKRQEFNLKDITPKTYAQEQFFDAYQQGYHVLGKGSAGSGKSYISLALALQDVLVNQSKSKIVIVRSAVPSREIGHLPGTIAEKLSAYEKPYEEIVNDLCGRGDAYSLLKQKDKIEFISSSFVRGLSIEDTVLIVDEFQNFSKNEIFSVISRVSKNTQLIMIGDTRQNDLNPRKEESCFKWISGIADKMTEDFDVVEFLPSDCVRSGFVRRLLMAVEE